MTEANEEEIAQVCSDENVVRGILFMGLFESGPRFVR